MSWLRQLENSLEFIKARFSGAENSCRCHELFQKVFSQDSQDRVANQAVIEQQQSLKNQLACPAIVALLHHVAKLAIQKRYLSDFVAVNHELQNCKIATDGLFAQIATSDRAVMIQDCIESGTQPTVKAAPLSQQRLIEQIGAVADTYTELQNAIQSSRILQPERTFPIRLIYIAEATFRFELSIQVELSLTQNTPWLPIAQEVIDKAAKLMLAGEIIDRSCGCLTINFQDKALLLDKMQTLIWENPWNLLNNTAIRNLWLLG